ARTESPGCTSAIWLSATTQELPMGRSVKPSGAPKLSINHLSRKRVCPFSSLATNDSVAISKLRRSSSTKTFPESFTLQLANRTVHIVRRGDLQQNKPQFSAEEKDGGLYLRIPSFGDQNVESSAVDAIEKHLKSPFIIIEVRGKGGGSTPQGLLAKLMEKPYHIWRESTPDHIGIFRAWGAERGELSWSGTFTPSEDRYRGPVYLLVDGGCASACEDFVAPFKETQRAVI